MTPEGLLGKQPFTTDTYRLTASTAALYMGERWLGRWWWAIAVPLGAVALTGAATADARWWVVLAALVLLLLPTLALTAFLSALASPPAVRALLPCQSSYDPRNGLRFRYCPPEDGSGQPREFLIPMEKISGCCTWRGYAVIDTPRGPCFLPLGQLPAPEATPQGL